ncbi:MAG: phosphoribosylformylglycinamidine cyclo-ligase [Ardenticatenales bacterium]|nr:phosphoribosylformylglycinamidine cyclo-ligase [Ardenticatenales bacterium]
MSAPDPDTPSLLTQPLTYAQTGVDYTSLDPAKVMAQRAAAATAGALARFDHSEVAASRGESAFVWDEGDRYRAMVIEGLGTKSLVADATRAITGRSHYDALAQDTVAMIVNDLIVVGAAPQVVTAYWAVGDGAWFDDRERARDLVDGWAAACVLAGATWGGGETPALSGIIEPGTIDLAGAAIGVIAPKERLVLGDRLAAGDRIVLIESTGIHANGLSLARRVAERLPEGYATPVGEHCFGEALLAPTPIYASLVAALFEAGVDIRYLVNVTGHGWRKLMRAPRADLRYVLDVLPPVPAVLRFIRHHAGLDDRESYATLNMGAGFAVYAAAADAATVVDVAGRLGMAAWAAGRVEAGAPGVEIGPLGVTYEGGALGVRA